MPSRSRGTSFAVQSLHDKGLPMTRLLPLPFFLSAQLLANADEPGLVKSEFVFESAPVAQCHASTLAETGDTLVAAWFGGTREKNPDVGMLMSRRQGNAWSAPVEVANGVQENGTRYPCWNPVLFQPKAGRLMLFYK